MYGLTEYAIASPHAPSYQVHVPVFWFLLAEFGSPVLGETACSLRYSSSSLFCISNSACRSCRTRCFSTSRSTPLCIAYKQQILALLAHNKSKLGPNSKDRTCRPVIFLCPVHKVDNARCAQASGCQGQLRRTRHGDWLRLKVNDDDKNLQ